MRPLTDLSVASARALVAVAFDVDDTVTREGVLDASAYAAMGKLRDAGLYVLAATGRPLGFAEIFARTWPVHAAVGENGAGYVKREGRRCVRTYWDDEGARDAQRAVLDRIEARVKRELPHITPASDMWARRCDLAYDIGEEHVVTPEDITALCALFREEGAEATVSSVHAHAQLGKHDKATGITWALSREHGVSSVDARDHCLFVGDSGNDAAAFAWFPLSVGVANVSAHLGRLPTPPAYVAQRSHGAGFAEIVEYVLALRDGHV